MFELSKATKKEEWPDILNYKKENLQQHGFKAVKHQGFVGTSYFDAVQNTVTIGKSSTTAMKDSTETAQFKNIIKKKARFQMESCFSFKNSTIYFDSIISRLVNHFSF
jgi:hypothetical protein